MRAKKSRAARMNLCTDCIYWQEKEEKSFFSCFNKRSEFFNVPSPHKLTWRECTLYEEALPEWLKGIKFIEDFRGQKKFKNSVFWVIGADTNLDFYQPPYLPTDFFKNKFSIAVNLVQHVFPESTFYIADWGVIGEMKSNARCDLGKCILTLRTEKLRSSANLFGFSPPLQGRDLEPIYMRTGAGSMISSRSDFEPVIRQIFSDKPCIFCSIGTSSHLAIFAAAILGAKKVVMVACSHRIIGLPFLKLHSHRPGLERYIEADAQFLFHLEKKMKMWRENLVLIAEIFKEYGVEVVRHRYDEEKRKFVFEEIVE